MVHPRTLVILGLAGCGRLGFDARLLADDAAGDSAQPESDLVLRVKFEGDGHDIIGGRDPTCVGAGCPIDLTSSPSMAGPSG